MINETQNLEGSSGNSNQSSDHLERNPEVVLSAESELGLLRACFDSLMYLAPEDLSRVQFKIAMSLSRLAKCACLEASSKAASLPPLTDFEVSSIVAGFTGSLSRLAKDAANAQRTKADFELSKSG